MLTSISYQNICENKAYSLIKTLVFHWEICYIKKHLVFLQKKNNHLILIRIKWLGCYC
ncbi:conserved hypothetical protein [Brochothrix thermosphacta]|nr:conserved hypothetical protein [Brochothrix thermosphacta]